MIHIDGRAFRGKRALEQRGKKKPNRGTLNRRVEAPTPPLHNEKYRRRRPVTILKIELQRKEEVVYIPVAMNNSCSNGKLGNGRVG